MPWHEKVLIGIVIVAGLLLGAAWLLHAIASGDQ